MTVTDSDIRELRAEANTAGDREQVALCAVALVNPAHLGAAMAARAAAARAECARVILAWRNSD